MENNRYKSKRIGIDARFYGPVGKGLGRYTKEIVDNITRLDRENQYVIFLRRENFSEFAPAGPNVKKILTDVRWYGLAEQIILPFYIWREKLDLMHFPHFNVPLFTPVKFIVTIHDLILIKFPTARATTLGPWHYKIKNLAYKIVISTAIRRAKKVLTVSEFTKNDIVSHFKTDPGKISVIYEGVASLSESREKGSATMEIEPPYLLYVGNAYPHKNLEGLIKAFAELSKRENDLKLVLVGKEDYFYRRLKDYAEKISAKIIFPGYIPDAELKKLYKNASAYVFPSFYEGFGLPPLEAMANGLPVASSNRSCLKEILGDAALYFNPESQGDMKEKIYRLINDENLRQELKDRGLKQAEKFSWSDCARKTLEVYLNTTK